MGFGRKLVKGFPIEKFYCLLNALNSYVPSDGEIYVDSIRANSSATLKRRNGGMLNLATGDTFPKDEIVGDVRDLPCIFTSSAPFNIMIKDGD